MEALASRPPRTKRRPSADTDKGPTRVRASLVVGDCASVGTGSSAVPAKNVSQNDKIRTFAQPWPPPTVAPMTRALHRLLIIAPTLAKPKKDDYLSRMTLALLAMGLGLPEILVIVVVILLLFGPSKLPQLGEGIGKMLRGFKKEMKALDEERAADSSRKERDEVREPEIDVTPKTGDEARKTA